MDRIKISGEPIFIGDDEMSRTVDEIFESWLRDCGAEIIGESLDIDTAVKDAVSDFVSNDGNIYDKIVDMLKNEVDGGTFNEDIIEGIKDACILSLEERVDELKEEIASLHKRMDEWYDTIVDTKARVGMLESVTYRTWGQWLKIIFGLG